ncbi:GGDEF domain-containing protein [Octadecabacter sp. G9-8]|uniref:diguanylate cyclase n=1 Tax=Octadecabacter dasysiphoniae TaxID=2909341 RepID=A0ABS9CYF9_9RHOB|nr:GGDEF domain-containing protein [Octadecabacter dasysiphoniae]MCF2872292.1 GGDEF domain-containing protein [Octadecabacter dasysiphoniae]
MAFVKSNMRANGQFNYIRFVLRLRVPLAAATMCLAVLGLAANYFGVDPLLRPLGDRSATHPVTALCLFAIGFGVLKMDRFGHTPIWRHMLGAVVIAVCATRLMQAEVSYAAGAPSLDIFGPIGGFSGRFSVEAALALGAFGLATVLRQGLGRWGIVILLVGCATVFNTLLEISYGLTFFNGDVGAFTLLGLTCAAVCMITLYIHRPLVRVCFLAGNIGHQTRIMALAAIAVPWACGFFLHSVRNISATSIPYEAGMVSIISWSMLMILLVTASHLESTDVARRRAEREVAMLARIDPQTKALNRFGLSEMLDSSWVEFKSSGTMFGILLLDVEYFLRINETFGHDPAENVLERVAATIQPQLRDHDALGRWNGEEFIILLKIKERSDLDVVAGRLRAALQDANSPFAAGLDGEPMDIIAPFGMAQMQSEDRGPAEMMTRADMALHITKNSGHDQAPIQYELGDERGPMLFDDLEEGDQKDEIAA